MTNPNCKWAKPFINPFTYPDQGYICTLFKSTYIPSSHHYCIKAENKKCEYYEETKEKGIK